MIGPQENGREIQLVPRSSLPVMKQRSSLKVRSIRRMALTVLTLTAILLVSAGSLHFWQAWLLVALQTASWTFFFAVFLKRDPQLLERRLQSKESEPEQKWFQRLWTGITIPAFILTGLDFRYGWTQRMFGGVPVRQVVVAQGVVVFGYWLVFWVMRTNTFAATTIQVEAEQVVIDNGPYRLVRHPMYLGLLITMLAVPVALGSYVTVPLFAFVVPTIVFRLIHEERTLRGHLPGYREYCGRTRYRLVPGVW
jgi:protein-S-isoprenylcysteine O-methyltransferase Ste14